MKIFLRSVFILIVMGLTIGISSCSDDTTTPTPSADIMPLTTGSHYVYNVIRLDSLTGQRDLNAAQVDSMVVGGSSLKDGKTAYAFDVFRSNVKIRTDLYAKEGQTVWGYWQFIPPGIVLTELINTIIPQTRRWSKFADFNATTEWTIADTNVTGVSVPFNGTTIPLSSNISMKGKKLETSSVAINGASFPNTTKFELTLTLKPSITIFGNALQVDPIVVKQYIWIAQNVGIVKEEFPALDLKVTIPGIEPIQFKGDGFVRELLRYSVK
ncbi:MAG: hypothetical protein ACK5GO_05500 [Ignavibacteria bacterium]|jgi:hypothetical protein